VVKDSQSAIAISCNPVQHSRTKHIHTRYHFIKEQVENGIIELYFVRTEYQLADMFTKALPEDRFKYLVRRIGMRCLTPADLELIVDIEDDIMDPVMQCTTLPSHSGFSQKKLVSFVIEIHTLSIDISLRDYLLLGTKLSILEALKGLILRISGAITLSLFTTIDSREEGVEFKVIGFDKAFVSPTLGITLDFGRGVTE
ncbi:hypothetical protein Tco_1371897, partial [Tanacetum coccineum]